MPYEVRIPGQPAQTFATEPEAMEAAKRAMAGDPDAEPEVIDLDTGKPAAPGADKASREELRGKVGF